MLHPGRPVKRPIKDILPTLNALGYFSAAQRIQCYWKKRGDRGKRKMVEPTGIEPATTTMPLWCSTN